MYHGAGTKEIPECSDLNHITQACWFYDTNQVGIYTKKFSRFVLYAVAGPSGGGGSVLRMDTCPDGDHSPSYYDGLCDALKNMKSLPVPDLLKPIEPEQQSLFDAYDFTALKPLSKEIRSYIELKYIARINAAIDRKTDNLSKKIQIYRQVVAYLEKRLHQTNINPREEKVFRYVRLILVRAINKFDTGAMAKR